LVLRSLSPRSWFRSVFIFFSMNIIVDFFKSKGNKLVSEFVCQFRISVLVLTFLGYPALSPCPIICQDRFANFPPLCTFSGLHFHSSQSWQMTELDRPFQGERVLEKHDLRLIPQIARFYRKCFLASLRIDHLHRWVTALLETPSMTHYSFCFYWESF
jgi:hypothetical protein